MNAEVNALYVEIDRLRAVLYETGECCRATDPRCAAGCLQEKQVRDRFSENARLRAELAAEREAHRATKSHLAEVNMLYAEIDQLKKELMAARSALQWASEAIRATLCDPLDQMVFIGDTGDHEIMQVTLQKIDAAMKEGK